MEDDQQIKLIKRKSYQSSDSYGSFKRDEEDNDVYDEPCFAGFMRNLGCCFGYAFLPLCGLCCYPYKTVDKGSRAVIQEFGRLKREVGEGLHYVNPITEKLTEVSQKIQVIDLERQNVMTADKLSIDIDSVVYYQITTVADAIFKVQNVVASIIELSYTTLRNVIGKSTLEQCLSKREQIAKDIKEIIDESVHNWGVQIISLQIKDIKIPVNIMTSLSSAVTAERDAEAKIITARANVEAAQLMRQASDILDTPAAMQVRSLEVIDRLIHSQNAKVIILPSDLNLSSNIKGNLVSNEIDK